MRIMFTLLYPGLLSFIFKYFSTNVTGIYEIKRTLSKRIAHHFSIKRKEIPWDAFIEQAKSIIRYYEKVFMNVFIIEVKKPAVFLSKITYPPVISKSYLK